MAPCYTLQPLPGSVSPPADNSVSLSQAWGAEGPSLGCGHQQGGERPGMCPAPGPRPSCLQLQTSQSLWTAEGFFFPTSLLSGSFVRQQHPLWSESSISSRTFSGVSVSVPKRVDVYEVSVWPCQGIFTRGMKAAQFPLSYSGAISFIGFTFGTYLLFLLNF